MKKKKKNKRIFLDYASITPIDRRVSMEMERAQKTTFANPSALYQEALTAKDFVEKGRKKIADILHAQKSEIVFTGGGTESNNLALFGLFEDFQRFDLKNSKCRTLGNKPHIITTKI